MSRVNLETGLIISKQTAIKMASESFFLNKRATVVCIRSYNKLVELSYKGKRSDESVIRSNTLVTRVVGMENREVS
jgi:hypothetical protein